MNTEPNQDGRRDATAIDWREWQHLTGAEIDAVPRERAVVLVTCSPLEVHGPHLPTCADNLEADTITRRAAELLAARHPELIFLHLPPLYVAADVIPHVGSLMFRSSTIVRVLSDLGRTLSKQGFDNIWVASFHGGPRHFVPIEVAAHRTNRRHGARMVSVFSLLINRLTGGATDLSQVLGDLDGVEPEDLVGDAHGGVIETSMLLHLLGEHVSPGYADLEPMTVDIALKRRGEPPLGHDRGRPSLKSLLRGFKEKLKYYEDQSYAGKPSIASAELGERFLERLAELAADSLDELLRGDLDPSDCHSPLWKTRWVFTNGVVGRLFERVMRYRNRVF